MGRKARSKQKRRAAAIASQAKKAGSPTPQLGERESRKRAVVWHILLIIGVVLITYANTLKNGFVHDDTAEILQNPYVHDFSHISKILTSPAWAFGSEAHIQAGSNYYRPVQYLVYAVLYPFFGQSAVGYHAFKLALHLSVCLVFYWILRRYWLPDWPALMATVLFVVHPANTEAVTWISGMTDVSCALLLLVSLLFYLKFQVSSRLPWLVLAQVGFFVGLFAKETMATFVLILIAYEWLILRKSPWRLSNLRVYLPLGVAFIVYLVMRVHAIGGFTSQSQLRYDFLGFFEGLLNQVALLSEYFTTFFWPVSLNAYRLFDPVLGVSDPRFLRAILTLLVLGGTALLLSKRSNSLSRHLLLFGLLWFVLTLLPVLIFFKRIGENVFAERYLYLPGVGLCLALSIALARMKDKAPRPTTLGCMVLVGLLSWMTIERNRVWRNELVFYETTIKASPKAALILNNLGTVYASKLRYQDALKAFQLSVAARPNWSAYKNLGPVLGALGRTDEAIAAYQQAIALYSSDAEIYSGLGDLYFGVNRYPEAISVYQQALKLQRNYPRVWFNMADACMIVGRYDEALGAYQEVLQLSPKEAARAYLGMANAYRALKLFDQAADANRKAMAVQ